MCFILFILLSYLIFDFVCLKLSLTTKQRFKAEVHFYQKSKGRKGKEETRTQVQRSGFRDSGKVKQLRQIGAEMVQYSKATT